MEEILGIDAMTAVILTGAVMGAVELVKRLFAKDWQAAVIVFVSALVGGIAGAILGLMPLQGIAFGLAASGYITLAGRFGNKGTTVNVSNGGSQNG